MSTTSRIPEGLPDWLAPHVDEVAGWGPTSAARGCWVARCERDAVRLGLCSNHFQTAKRRWSPSPSDATRGRRRKHTGVVPADDSETSPATPNNNDRGGHR